MARPAMKKVLLALACSGALVVAGCGADDGDSSSKTSQENKAPLFNELPKDIQDAGKIVIGSSIDYPPFEYYAEDGKTLQGFEPELAAELEKKLGVKFEWNNASFDTLFTALRSGRYDIVYGATNDTLEREQTFDFVDYLQSSQGFVVAKGNPHNIQVLDDICGKPIAVVRGGVQAQFLDEQTKKCTESGKPAIKILPFDGNSGEQLAVKQDQAAAMLENYPTAVTFAKESNGALEVVPDLQVSKRYFGMVLDKKDTELRDALQKAWQAIIDDGSYDKVLSDWDLSEIGIDEAKINAVGEDQG
ncbi:MAG TPA: ABC transporter substrate-binding protein [Actinomycetales bacterium]|nr:ABC transporter substrate-binding protein [Actinomycetales bacterium]